MTYNNKYVLPTTQSTSPSEIVLLYKTEDV